MKRLKQFLIIGLLLVGSIALGDVALRANEGLSLTWGALTSGGGVSEGGDYAINGAIGQIDGGQASGGTYTMSSGFASPLPIPVSEVQAYLPLITTK